MLYTDTQAHKTVNTGSRGHGDDLGTSASAPGLSYAGVALVKVTGGSELTFTFEDRMWSG